MQALRFDAGASEWGVMMVRAVLFFWALLGLVELTSAADQKGQNRQADSRKSSVSDVPFDLAWQALPPGYAGQNLFELEKSLRSLKAKGEFESSAEYDDRLAKWSEKPLVGTIKLTSFMSVAVNKALSPDVVDMQYDADKEEMLVKITYKPHLLSDGNATFINTVPVWRNLVGSELFVLALAVSFRSSPLEFKLPIDREKAKRMKVNSDAYFVFRLAEPYRLADNIKFKKSADFPTGSVIHHVGVFADLVAIWFADRKSGEVYSKYDGVFVPYQ